MYGHHVVNLDLNSSDSERKSLCLRSIKINMKKSKINLELSAKPEDRPSYTTGVNTSLFTHNIESSHGKPEPAKSKLSKGNTNHMNKHYMTKSHYEEFLNRGAPSKTSTHTLHGDKPMDGDQQARYNGDREFFSNDKIKGYGLSDADAGSGVNGENFKFRK